MSETKSLTPTLDRLVALAEKNGWEVEIEYLNVSSSNKSIFVRFVRGYDRLSAWGSYLETLSHRWRHGAVQHWMTRKADTITLKQLRTRLQAPR